jgi:hypothetical protein
MSRNKKQQTTVEIYTQVVPVVFCSDNEQVNKIMNLCGIPRALTYNKLGSRQGWQLDWKKADTFIRTILKPTDISLPAKLWEWSVNDAMKSILAQQEASKTFIIRAIFQKTKDEGERKKLLDLLKHDPTVDNWLHRIFRNQYQRGHTYIRNQIVYQSAGYTCKRLGRNTVKLVIAGLVKGKRIVLTLKCRHIISGQIRLIRSDAGKLEIHCTRQRTYTLPKTNPDRTIGIDKGYTEAFYTSEGDTIAEGLGQLMTAKTQRITSTNRNRYRLRCYAANNPEKTANILKHNLGYLVKSRRLKKEKETIKNFIKKDLRKTLTSPTQIFALRPHPTH